MDKLEQWLSSELTKLVVEAIIGARAVGATALQHRGLSRTFHRSGNDTNSSCECNETGSKRDHVGLSELSYERSEAFSKYIWSTLESRDVLPSIRCPLYVVLSSSYRRQLFLHLD
jgi:hypothetical protein